MRVLMLGLALAVLAARPAGAGRMLYATAATPNRIDGFCLRGDGSIAPTPSVRAFTGGTEPRRLVVSDIDGNGVSDVLYVAERDRVDAFKIGDTGELSPNGKTKPRERQGPRDLAINASRTMLYVPDRSRSRIVGHPLDAGRPAEDFTTCIQGEIGASYQNLFASPDRLYVSSSGGNGRIEVFGIAADGSLFGLDGPTQLSDCVGATADAPRPDATPPLSERRRIADIKSFVIIGDLLYAEDRGRRRIRAFQLQPDGNLPPPASEEKTCENEGPSAGLTCTTDADCTNDPACSDGICECKTRERTWQKAVSKTNNVAQYQQILNHNSALLATQFFKGRIDSYELKSGSYVTPGANPDDPADDETVECQNCLLPRKPTRLAKADLRYTPVRLTADANVVYVASGEFNRILAYRLHDNGVLRDKDPFSQTDEQHNSFPNDVAVAMLAAGCP